VTPDEIREELFKLNLEALKRLMDNVIAKGMTNETAMLVCIHVDDGWWELTEALMPGHDWQQYRDRNEKPIARGSVHKPTMVDLISLVAPELSSAFKPLPPKCFHVAVMDAGGISLFYLANADDVTIH
jgi:hypothetical protein